jgi:hypothetical protein
MKMESKIKLYEIQTKDDFEKKYSKKIVKLYYSLNTYKNNDKIADIIKQKIMYLDGQNILTDVDSNLRYDGLYYSFMQNEK